MPLKFKIDVLEALKENGYSSARIRKEALLSESTLQKFRRGDPVSWETLERLCDLLRCGIDDIIEYVKE